MTKRSPIHVCSLALSSLNAVKDRLNKELDAGPQDGDENFQIRVNKLRWAQLSMEYNRQVKFQNVLSHLNTKNSDPRFRQARTRPPFTAWRREVNRQRFMDIAGVISNKAFEERLNERFESFSNQRIQVASKSINNMNVIDPKPIFDLVKVDDALEIFDGFAIKRGEEEIEGTQGNEFKYIASSAVATMSELPTAETLNEDEDELDEDVKQRIRSRGIMMDEEESGNKRLMNAAERAEMSLRKSEVKEESNSLKITIIVLVVLIFAVAIGIILAKRNINRIAVEEAQCYQATPTPKPTKAPKIKATPTPSPSPTPKPRKGWFF